MKNIIIFYQVINREMESCKALKKELEDKNDVKAYIFSIDFEHDRAIKLSKKEKIDMVIMPWMYQDSNYLLLQPFVQRNPHLIIINLHHEQIGSEASINRMLPSGENAKNSVVHFVWGNFFKDALLSVGVKENLIYVTGNIRTDNTFLVSKDRITLSKEFNLDTNKKWILFSENRGWVLTNNEKKEKHMIYLGYNKNDIIDRKRIAKESLEITVKEMNKLESEFFEKYELIYRAHPGTESPTNLNSMIKVIDKYPIYEWLNVIDINLVWSSTTIFESDMKKIPSIVYEPIKNSKRHKTYGLEKYQTISSFSEIGDELIKKYNEIIAPQKIYEKYIGKVDGKSTIRVKEAILNILKEGIMNYGANPMTYDKKNYFRTILFQKVTRIFVRLKILDIIKYPKSAYELRKDIPYRLENK